MSKITDKNVYGWAEDCPWLWNILFSRFLYLFILSFNALFCLPFSIIIILKSVYFVFFQLSLGTEMQRGFFKITSRGMEGMRFKLTIWKTYPEDKDVL